MTVLVGLDPSLNRVGWAAVHTDTGACITLGCEATDVRDGGWRDTQFRDAFHTIQTTLSNLGVEVEAWCREEPITRFVRVAKQHGEACALTDHYARSVWPHAIALQPAIHPAEWRRHNNLPAGAAGKDAAVRLARDLAPPGVVVSQDAADALMVALTALHDWQRMDGAA